MVVFYLRNSRAPDDKVVPITISLQLDATKLYKTPAREDQSPTASGTEFPNLLDPEGDRIWLLVVSPPRGELDKDTGQPIPPEFVNVVSEDTVHEEIQSAMGRIGERIEGPLLLEDTMRFHFRDTKSGTAFWQTRYRPGRTQDFSQYFLFQS